MAIATPTGEYKCHQCSTHYTSTKGLKRHVDSVHYQGSHVCDICGEILTREDNLTRHKMSSDCKQYDQIFDCDVCNASFARKDDLLRHKRFDHEIEDDALNHGRSFFVPFVILSLNVRNIW